MGPPCSQPQVPLSSRDGPQAPPGPTFFPAFVPSRKLLGLQSFLLPSLCLPSQEGIHGRNENMASVYAEVTVYTLSFVSFHPS